MLRLMTERMQGRRRRADHRQGRSEVGDTSRARSIPASGCTSAPSSATASARSSAARACAASSSRSAARSASSSPTSVVVKQMIEVFENDWAQTPSGRKKRKKEEKAEKAEKKERSWRRPRSSSVVESSVRSRSVWLKTEDSRLMRLPAGDRQKSIVDTRWTQPTVQYGAHDFGVENSRRMSSIV